MERECALKELIDKELAAVCFVRDYVEFQFDGPTFRALSSPRLFVGDDDFTFPEPGSRDMFCTLIGKKIEQVKVSPDVSIELLFEYGDRLVVPLDAENRVGPEAANYTRGLNQGVFVW